MNYKEKEAEKYPTDDELILIEVIKNPKNDGYCFEEMMKATGFLEDKLKALLMSLETKGIVFKNLPKDAPVHSGANRLQFVGLRTLFILKELHEKKLVELKLWPSTQSMKNLDAYAKELGWEEPNYLEVIGFIKSLIESGELIVDESKMQNIIAAFKGEVRGRDE